MTNQTETSQPQKTGYLSVNGLEMYYEVHGKGGTPLVLIHGAFSAIGTSFSSILPGLAATRTVVGLELQAHGRTADIDRAMSIPAFADDVAKAIEALGYKQVDLLGYSTGAAVALELVNTRPELVRRLVLISVAHRMDGIQPGLMDGLGQMKPEMMHGSMWHDEYLKIAPRPQEFPRLFAKKTAMDREIKDQPAETISGIKSPTLLIAGDADLVRPEHAVEMFRLLGGGGFGDTPAGHGPSELAIIPGASHVTVVFQGDVLVKVISRFLDKEVRPAT
jgi:pimeloyl-ACP methyl ester carboxylesterase